MYVSKSISRFSSPPSDYTCVCIPQPCMSNHHPDLLLLQTVMVLGWDLVYIDARNYFYAFAIRMIWGHIIFRFSVHGLKFIRHMYICV